MRITPVQTPRLTSKSSTLQTLLDQCLPSLQERTIVAITSKVVALCEGSTVPLDATEKLPLAIQEADLYLPNTLSKYNYSFTIKNDTLIPMAGIDESNAGGCYVLWPRDAQQTCNDIREYLAQRFGLSQIGVIITDSTSRPLRKGTAGICLAHSGFAALNNYVGAADLFGKPMRVTEANISEGLAAAAVVCMGEGSEQTPLAIITDIDRAHFQDRNPSPAELEYLHIALAEDLFAPFLQAVPWQKGGKS